MNQSRLSSLIEALFNVAIGFGINFTANMLFFPLFGWHISASQNLALGAIYTVISVARSYVIRRWFNAMLHRAARRLAGEMEMVKPIYSAPILPMPCLALNREHLIEAQACLARALNRWAPSYALGDVQSAACALENFVVGVKRGMADRGQS